MENSAPTIALLSETTHISYSARPSNAQESMYTIEPGNVLIAINTYTGSAVDYKVIYAS